MDYSNEKCNQIIYNNGTQLALLDSPQKIMNKFVIELQERLNSYEGGDVVDWHYAGGRALLLYMGSEERVVKEFFELLKNSKYKIGVRLLKNYLGNNRK